MKSLRKFWCTLLTVALLLGIASYGVPPISAHAAAAEIPAFTSGTATHSGTSHDAGPTPDCSFAYQTDGIYNYAQDGSGNYQLTYSDVTANEVANYEASLVTAGFELYDEREIENGSYTSRFATYVNGDTMVHINYFPMLSNNQFHIIYGSAKYLLPNTAAAEYEAVITPSVAIVKGTDTSLCMVIQLADGSYVVIDGGYSTYASDGGRTRVLPETENLKTGGSQLTDYTSNFKEDHDTLLAYLQDTDRSGTVDDDEKTAKPNVIWMATHADQDHIGLPISFLSDNHDTYNYHQYINLTAIIYNFPNYTNIGCTDDVSNLNLRVKRFIHAATTAFPDAKHYIYHTGQVLNLPGCQIEFLHTAEDYYPNAMTSGNHTSGMWRFLFDGGKSLLITGDSEDETTTQVYNVLGDYLKSDMLQVIHHGANGATVDFNNAVDPQICFWSCLDILFYNDTRMLGTKSDAYLANQVLRNGKRTHYTLSDTSTVYIPTVSYNANGGTGTMASETGLYGAQAAKEGVVSPTFQSTLSENGFTGPDNSGFLGWATSPNGEVAYEAGQSLDVTSSTELYAVWGETVTFESIGHNVRLQDLIKIGFYYKVTANITIEAFGTLLWTEEDYNNDEDHTVNSALAANATITSDNGTYIAETDGIYAQYMDTVYYAIPYVKTASGSYYYGTVDQYSVLDYAEKVYSQTEESWADTKTIIIDLLNYATAARTYFGFTEGVAAPDQPFNHFLTAAEQSLAWDDRLLCIGSTGNDGIGGSFELEEVEIPTGGVFDAKYIGRNVNLLDAISLGVYYGTTDVTGAYYWAGTRSGSAQRTDYDPYVKMSITGIYPDKMYDNYYIRAYNSENVLSEAIKLSVADYLSAVIAEYSDNTDEESLALIELAKAMLIYGDYAKTYFTSSSS